MAALGLPVQPEAGAALAPWDASEIWAVEVHPELRLVELEGAASVDPTQTELPDEWRARVHQLRAHHTLTAASGYSTPEGDADEIAARNRQRNPELTYPDDGAGAWHPAVVTHPETGRTALYVSEFVSHFEGYTPDETRAMVRELRADL